MAENAVAFCCFIHFLAKLTYKIGKLYETNVRTAPKVIMNLRYHLNARGSII
jgi:hypothetical protein